jgi:hypothetical protein
LRTSCASFLGATGLRIYDPDGYIIDISETHGALMRRLAAEGMPKDRIAAHVTLIQEQIDKYLTED